MKKFHKYWLSPTKSVLFCEVYIDNKLALVFTRNLISFAVKSVHCISVDVTTFDLELHAFMRLSHQYIVGKDSLDVKIEDAFELDNPNLF